jgi:phosphoribosylglycinamide formyltransferase-1
MKRIAIFASGSGTNAQNFFEYFADHRDIKVDSLFSNKPGAYVLERAKKFGVPAFLISRESFYSTGEVLAILKERKIDLIVLAGFLWLVPKNLIDAFRIVNIHPALLPKYGGKGMYGMKVHSTVVANKEPESGITIHYVNEVFDNGEIIFQAKCKVEGLDSPEDVAAKVHQLEYKYFPRVVEEVLMGQPIH